MSIAGIEKKAILHIIAHMGGGAGRFLSETIAYEAKNKILGDVKVLLLEKPEKNFFFDNTAKAGVEVAIFDDDFDMPLEISKADLVIIHWWHHPIMAKFLSEIPKVETRIIFWNHISGCTYPNLPYALAITCHKLFLATPYTYENPLWSDIEKEAIKEKSAIMYGIGVSKTYETPIKIGRNGSEGDNEFRIIYVGTLNKSKINNDIIEYCHEVIKLIPNAKLYFLGDLAGSEFMQEKVRDYGLENHFKFVAYTDNVYEYLENADAFGYLLNPYHFGSTENVIIEAMTVGLPVVMLNQGAERYIVEHNYDGLLVNDINEYALTMKYLFEHPEERLRIGENARETVKTKFSIAKNVQNMHEQMQMVQKMDKKQFDFAASIGNTPYQWFLNCLGEDKDIFEKFMKNPENTELREKIKGCKPILKEKNKSSIRQFADKFPEDKELMFLKRIIEEEKHAIRD